MCGRIRIQIQVIYMHLLDWYVHNKSPRRIFKYWYPLHLVTMTRIFPRKKVKAHFPATPNFQIIYIFLQLEKWILSILGTRLKF